MSRPNPNKKFHWTGALDEVLRRVYHSAPSREALSRNLDHLQRVSGFSRVAIQSRAAGLGLSFCAKRLWTKEELDFLREQSGSLSQAAIARKLKRSYWSVKAQFSRLQLSARVTEGYSQFDLMHLLGVSRRQVLKWLALGWIRMREKRITEHSIVQFLRRHPEQYQLRRVDEAWYKGLLFPAFNRIENLSRQDLATLPLKRDMQVSDSMLAGSGSFAALAGEAD